MSVVAMLKIFSAVKKLLNQTRPPMPFGLASRRVTDARPAVSATESRRVRLRAPQRDGDLVLSSVAEAWLTALPWPLRPAELCSAYPRVANRLALCWDDPALTERLLDDLLISRRVKRMGFPRPVAEELLRLHRFHEHYRSVEIEDTIWECRSLAVSDRVPSADLVHESRMHPPPTVQATNTNERAAPL